MASFTLTKGALAFLSSCLNAGFGDPTVPCAQGADEEAIAALLEEIDAIVGRDGSAEITIMGDEAGRDKQWLIDSDDAVERQAQLECGM